MTGSPLDVHLSAIYLWLKDGKNNREIADLVGESFSLKTTESSIRRCIQRNESLQEAARERDLKVEASLRAEAPGVAINGDEVIITGDATTEEPNVKDLTTEDLLKRHKLDPEQWEVSSVLVNQWEMGAGGLNKHTLYQFKVWFKRRVPLKLILPAKIGQVHFPTPQEPDRSVPFLTVVLTDQQAPFIDEQLHELILRWLRKNKPMRGVIGGDVLDNGYISRHRDDPAWHRTVQDCIDSGTKMLEDYRYAWELTGWSLLKGNHDDRIRNEQLERNERLYNIRPGILDGENPQEQVYSLNHLLRLTDLGIAYHEPKGTYEFEQIPINELISARHGYKVSKGAAMKTAEELGHSVVLGHTHRQSVTRKTVWNSLKKRWHVITAVEAGCLCNIQGGLGYANGGCPDWQPGFATVTTFPDGGYSFDLATYEQNGILRWRDQVYTV